MSASNVCGLKFANLQALTSHQHSAHTGSLGLHDATAVCVGCNARVTSFNDMNANHLNHNLVNIEYVCKQPR